jgi:type 1 glutamine amidotransferase
MNKMRMAIAAMGLWVTSLAAAQPAPAPATAAGPGPMRTMPDPWPGMKKLLVIADVQTGFHHDSINHAMAVIERLGRESGSYATVIRTDSQLLTKQQLKGTGTRYADRPINARTLDFFDGVFYLGSGTGGLTDQQKADLLTFVKDDGKGLIVGHAATVAFYEWPEFTTVIGGFMEYEYPVSPMPLIVDDAAFPGASAFASTPTYSDQFPVMRAPFTSRDVHVILRLDPRQMTPQQLAHRPDGDMPVVWAKTYGKGRVYNNTIGHVEAVWDDPKFQALTLAGIRWALGLVEADARAGNSKPPAFTAPAADAHAK